MNSIIRSKKTTLSEKAYNFLREKIIKGEIKTSEIITEQNVALLLGMSRTPVKKAITRLEAENYVRSMDGIGTFVVGLSIQDLSDLYEVRKSIEILALKTAIENIKKEDIESLFTILDDLLERYKNNEKIEYFYIAEVDEQVHNLIIKNSRNNYVKTLLENIKGQIIRYQYGAYILTDTGMESTIQHKEIFNHIMKKDFKSAKKSLENHLDWSFKILSQALSGDISII